MLLNGGVLGLMHRDVAESVQPSARRWRLGTLILTSGLSLLAAQHLTGERIAIPLGNALLIGGVAEYWLSLELFDGRKRAPWVWLVAPALAAVLTFFLLVHPSFAIRSVIASFTWTALGLACIRSLLLGRGVDTSSGRRVLLLIFSSLTVTMAVRGLYFLVGPGREQSLLDNTSVVNSLSPLIASVLPIIGTTAFLAMCSDRLRRQLEHAASTDALTSLANRRTLTSVGTEALARARAAQAGLAVAVVDVDHFKSINDRFGHQVGDVALQHVAAKLRSACRSDDFPARQGGEEFVVVLHRVDRAQALAAAERLRRALADQPFQSGTLSLPLTASFGVAVLQAEDASFDDLLRRADQSLYRAKQNGRNRVEVAD